MAFHLKNNKLSWFKFSCLTSVNPILYIVFFLLSSFIVNAQLPIDCNNFYILKDGPKTIYRYNVTSSTYVTDGITIPSTAEGLAVSNNLNVATPAVTFYTTIAGKYWYYNGTTWVNTNHNCTNAAAAVNICGSGRYIYNLAGNASYSAEIYRYDGTGNDVLVAVIPNYFGVFDLIGDANGNFYLISGKTGAQRLIKYSPTGAVLCTYTLSGIPDLTYGAGFAIVGNKLYLSSYINGAVNYTYQRNYIGTITGTSITFTQTSTMPLSTSASALHNDFASCPFPQLTSGLSSSNNLTCLNLSAILTVTSTVTSPAYTWAGPGLVSTNTTTVSINQPGNYTVTVSGSTGVCSGPSTSTISITQNTTVPIITSTSVATSSVCLGQSSIINPSGALTYTLQPGNISGSSFTVNPTTTTVYTINGTNSFGCISSGTASLTRTIVVNQTPTITLGSTSSSNICVGNTVTITPSGASTYTLQPGNISGLSFTVNPVSTTIYTVSGTSASGCVSSGVTNLTRTIVVNPTPTITANAASSNSICIGNTATIIPNGASTYTLQPGNISGTSFTMNPTATTIYTVTGTSSAGCNSNPSSQLIKTITVNPTPTVIIGALTNDSVCLGNSIVLVPNGAISYTLQPDNIVATSFTLSPLANTVYTVSGANSNGCLSNATESLVLPITVTSLSVTVTSVSDVLCTGANTGSLSIFVSGGAPNYNYTWSNGAATNTITNLLAGVYSYTVVDVLSCSAMGTISISEPVDSLTINSVNLTNSCKENPTGIASLVVSGGTPIYSVLWNTGATGIELLNIGSGVYTASVTDSNGCLADTTIIINNLPAGDLSCKEMLIPEIFTPNGDGKNEKFEIIGIENYPNNTVQIFNRWGSLVYAKKNYKNEWDGKANTGNSAGKSFLPAGTYFVVIEFGDGKTETYKGHVMLEY